MNCASSVLRIQQLVCKRVCEDIQTWTWAEIDPYLAHRQILFYQRWLAWPFIALHDLVTTAERQAQGRAGRWVDH